MTKLNIKVSYSALYRPQAIGMLERQHRPLKDSLKAAIEEMGDKYQDRWMEFLPLVLLGRRTAYQPDLGASASELTFGLNLKIPGQLLLDPAAEESEEEIKSLIQSVKLKTDSAAVQPSRHNLPEKGLKDVPAGVTHVYTRQHQTKGLDCPYEGPFRIAERLSRSTIKIEVGLFKNGERRYEVRHLNDVRLAHPDSLAAPAQRPKLGRPTKRSAPSDGPTTTDKNKQTEPDPAVRHLLNRSFDNIDGSQNKSQNKASDIYGSASGIKETGPPPVQPFAGRPVRSTRNPNPTYVDATTATWSASQSDLEFINRSIGA